MTTLTYYLDTRAAKKDGTYPIKFYFHHRGQGAYINTGVSVAISQWNPDSCRVVHHPHAAQYNLMIQQYNTAIELEAARMRADLTLNEYTATELKRKFDALLHGESDSKGTSKAEKKPTFKQRLEYYKNSRVANATKASYVSLEKHIANFDPDWEGLLMEDITREWVLEFLAFLANVVCLKKNSIRLYYSKLRAVIKDALEDEVILRNPLRRIQVKAEPTRKRNLSVQELRQVMFGETEGMHPKVKEAQDMFKLIFCLIGINSTDLYSLDPEYNRRVNYVRSKTGKSYSIKIEPEAREILKKYKGTKKAVRYSEHESVNSFKANLCKIVRMLGEALIGKPITPYWARHSWASIASELDIPIETISAALGHSSGNPITQVYINYDMKKVDVANRRVIDYVFYGEGLDEE